VKVSYFHRYQGDSMALISLSTAIGMAIVCKLLCTLRHANTAVYLNYCLVKKLLHTNRGHV